jgi:hypothetical protein
MEDVNKWASVFNEKFEEFVKDLIVSFPNDKDFKLLKNSFSLLKMVDPMKPNQMFKRYVYKYKDQIVERDETFFMNHDFKYEMDSSESNFSLDILIKLKFYWNGLAIENKTIIWSYLSLLYKIDEKICI